MSLLVAIAAALLIFFVLWDSFETVILPRRASGRARLSVAVYRATWVPSSALVMVGLEGVPTWGARLTFAIARHTAVDLSQVFGTPPRPGEVDRLPPDQLSRLRETLAEAGLPLRAGSAADRELVELRWSYEPYVQALSRRFLMPLPPWIPPAEALDAWQTSAWEETSIGSFDEKG